MLSRQLSQFFFSFSPILIYVVVGSSMEPLYKEQHRVIVLRAWFTSIRENDVVVAIDPRDRRVILKRIKGIDKQKFFLLGDNEKESTDSRHFGWISKKQIIGRVISSN